MKVHTFALAPCILKKIDLPVYRNVHFCLEQALTALSLNIQARYKMCLISTPFMISL